MVKSSKALVGSTICSNRGFGGENSGTPGTATSAPERRRGELGALGGVKVGPGGFIPCEGQDI